MKKPLLLLCTTLVLFLFSVASCDMGKTNKEKLVTASKQEIDWAWSKNVQGLTFDHLSMSWNGSKILFSAKEKKVTTNPDSGNILIGISQKAKDSFVDWRVNKEIEKVFLSGSAEELLIETKEGQLLFYRNWDESPKFKTLEGRFKNPILSPTGRMIIAQRLSEKEKNPSAIEVFDADGKLFGEVALEPAVKTVKTYFPFLSTDQRWLLLKDNGELAFFERDRLIWKKQVGGSPRLVTSSFLEGGLILVVTGENPSKLHLFNQEGQNKANATIQGKVTAIGCSKMGGNCGILAKSKTGLEMVVFDHTLEEAFRFRSGTTDKMFNKLLFSNKGGEVMASFMDKDTERIFAWDSKGKALWCASAKEGIKDFEVSWDGKKVVMLSKADKVYFYDLNQKKGEEERIH